MYTHPFFVNEGKFNNVKCSSRLDPRANFYYVLGGLGTLQGEILTFSIPIVIGREPQFVTTTRETDFVRCTL